MDVTTIGLLFALIIIGIFLGILCFKINDLASDVHIMKDMYSIILKEMGNDNMKMLDAWGESIKSHDETLIALKELLEAYMKENKESEL